MRQEVRDGLHFVQDLRSPFIGDAHDQGVRQVAAAFFLTQGKDVRAGSVGNCVRVAEVLISVSQRMKGKKVQGAMRHEDQMLGVELLTDRSNEFCIERCEMALGCGEQWLLEAMSISGTQAKLRNRKAQEVKKVPDPLDYAARVDLDRFRFTPWGHEPIADGIVFD